MITLGVEEEYLLLDPARGVPVARSARVRALAGGEVGAELLRSQVEVATPVCADLAAVGTHLARLRRVAGAAAVAAGCRVAMTGAVPFAGPDPVPVTDEPRYRALAADTPRLIHEHAINGMHVHVAVPGRKAGVDALNRVRPWLPVLVAMGANSPLADGRETGFASWRTLVFGRWPVSGPPPVFAGAEDYERRVAALLASGVVRGRNQLYWQARLSDRYPTLEVRAVDVQLRVDEAVMFAGLARALVVTALREGAAGVPVPGVPQELLLAVGWGAARWGLDGEVLDPVGGRVRPVAEVVGTLLAYVGPALAAAGDLERVTGSVRRLLREGTGAGRQRRALAAGGAGALVDLLTGSPVGADGGGGEVEDP
ncbi:carboxylate-amine ligase [Streptomyces sp. NBC_01803]|uniref:carboxylate-amine ligase n=1 Tax=Streptomyces sp. NBC_01803 TaxID=2975946 RepID=UPI002DDB912F|nr:glutamate--cysteine ligase [Streptomyces sp. NBC_01803]WSA45267.1 glutamate--cysteine ligase [Streptomyces sp. NBC_01803]